MKSQVRGGWAILWCAMGLACESTPEEALPTAEIGIFYGGQIQRVQELEVSLVKPPKLGFRIHLPEMGADEASGEREVVFELVRPGPAGRRVTKKGKFSIPRGAAHVDHLFELEPPLHLGLWNVRVLFDDHVVADRALYLKPRPAGSP